MQALIQNRSPWLVTVTRPRELSRQFPFPKHDAAESYLAEIRAQGLRAKLNQLESSFQVRIRRTGYTDQCVTFDTQTQAEAYANRILADQAIGLDIDPQRPRRTLFATLVQRYIRDECPKHKGGREEAFRLNKLLRDSGNEAVTWGGHANRPARNGRNIAKGQAAAFVQWMNRPFSALCAEDIEEYIDERLEEVSPATVDREVDMIQAVVNVAMNTWRYDLTLHPLRGLRRPKYFNERDRRLLAGEEELLLQLADSSASPYVGATVRLALATAMRRSELLSLRWENIDFANRCARLADTKNGRGRKVPLSRTALDVLESLPRDTEHVLDIALTAFKSAWTRLVDAGRALVTTHSLDDKLLSGLRFHDLRHEAISRLAESGQFPSVVDLQAVSGHRDPRMLLRYVTMAMPKLAARMDAAQLPSATSYVHRGRRRVRAFSAIEPVLSTIEMPQSDEAATAEVPSAVHPRLSATVLDFAQLRATRQSASADA